MTMGLKFQITAVQSITRTVKQINDSIARIGAPFRNLKKEFGELGTALGLPKISAGFGKVRSAIGEVGGSLRGLLAPMLALVGGGTIGGLIEMTAEWAKLGLQVDQTARSIGISTQSLQQLQGAARIMGIETGTLDGGLKALGDTLEDAMYGRNSEALMMLGRLGVRIRKTKDGAIDSVAAFNDMASAISRIKSPQVQGLVARSFGIEALLPLLRQGPAAIAAYEQKVKDLGGVMDGPAAAGAARLGLSMNYLGVAISGLKNSISAQLAPILGPLVDQLSTWIGANRELIAQKIGQWAKEFAAWIKQIDFKEVVSDIGKFVTKIGNVVDALGGWKNVAKGFAALIAIEFVAPIFSLAAALATLLVAATPLLPVFAAIAAIAGIGVAGYAMFKNMPDLSKPRPMPAAPGMRAVTSQSLLPMGVATAEMAAKLPNITLVPGAKGAGAAGSSSADATGSSQIAGNVPGASAPSTGAAPVQRVRADIHVTTDPGLTARVRHVWDSGLPSSGAAMVPGS